MKNYEFTVVIEPDEGGYHAYVPLLPGCHSFGATVDEARANTLEAARLHVECMQEDKGILRDAGINTDDLRALLL
jgi:predicted RNase H-like HicB family nuclease